MSRTRMMLAVGLVGMLAALALAQGSESSARRVASQHDSGTSIALLDEPTALSCQAGWKPVCVIRDGEQACACHPVPGVAKDEPGKLEAVPASPAAPARSAPDRPAPPMPKLSSDTPPVATN